MKTFPAHISIPTGYALLRDDKPIHAGDIILRVDPSTASIYWQEVEGGHLAEGLTPNRARHIACFKLKHKRTQ